MLKSGDMTKEDLICLLTLRAGEIERTLNLEKMTNIFITFEHDRKIHIDSKDFNRIVELLDPKVIVYSPTPRIKSGVVSFEYKLKGKVWTILSTWDYGKYGVQS